VTRLWFVNDRVLTVLGGLHPASSTYKFIAAGAIRSSPKRPELCVCPQSLYGGIIRLNRKTLETRLSTKIRENLATVAFPSSPSSPIAETGEAGQSHFKRAARIIIIFLQNINILLDNLSPAGLYVCPGEQFVSCGL